jgi:hypothetical protein
MKSKRSETIVVTDEFLSMEMHFFSDGTRASIIRCKKKDILKLAKMIEKKDGKMKSLKKRTGIDSFSVHLSPEICFFVKD